MDIYKKKSRWKLYMAVAGLVILIITIFYSNYLAQKLADNEVKNVKLFAQSIEDVLSNTDLQADISLQNDIIESISIPLIIEDESGGLTGFNFGETKDGDPEFLKNQKAKIERSGYPPIKGTGYASKIYYKNTNLFSLITYFPIVNGLLLGAFILLGYLLFSSAKRAEQNRVWAGMAKETAHQLGTPISAILAWIEHLKLTAEGQEDQLEIIDELRSDVGRLELIADRFSKIGSDPVLVPINVSNVLFECKSYMEKRAPRRVKFNFPEPDSDQPNININTHLFEWVIENLLRNSLDAMDGEGEINAYIYREDNMVCIDISDTGKGIPSSNWQSIFEPGFSTKSRGWGLGLSLAKRIVEEYHKGRILIKNSEIDKGTTFTIKLPTV